MLVRLGMLSGMYGKDWLSASRKHERNLCWTLRGGNAMQSRADSARSSTRQSQESVINRERDFEFSWTFVESCSILDTTHTVESRYLEPLRETKIRSRNREFEKSGGNWNCSARLRETNPRETKFGSCYRVVWETQGPRNLGSTVYSSSHSSSGKWSNETRRCRC